MPCPPSVTGVSSPEVVRICSRQGLLQACASKSSRVNNDHPMGGSHCPPSKRAISRRLHASHLVIKAMHKDGSTNRVAHLWKSGIIHPFGRSPLVHQDARILASLAARRATRALGHGVSPNAVSSCAAWLSEIEIEVVRAVRCAVEDLPDQEDGWIRTANESEILRTIVVGLGEAGRREPRGEV